MPRSGSETGRVQRSVPWPVTAIAASFLLYFGLLVYCDSRRLDAEGVVLRFSRTDVVVEEVHPGTPAAAAGLTAGDRILAYEGIPVRTRLDWNAASANAGLTGRHPVAVERAGIRTEIDLPRRPMLPGYWRSRPGISLIIARAIQATTLLIAMVVAFRRPRDPVALAGAWLIASFGVFTFVLPTHIASAWRSLPAPIGWLLWIPFTASLVVGASLFVFFANFPRWRLRRPVYWALVVLPISAAAAPMLNFAVRMVYAPPTVGQAGDWTRWIVATNIVYCGAAVISLARQYFGLRDVNERRRARVLVTGTFAGSLSAAVILLGYWQRSVALDLFASPWATAGMVPLLVLPLSFAYAILRHRLFDLRIIIRQSVQYALARRLLLSIVPLAAAFFVLDVWLHRDEPVGAIIGSHLWIYAALAGLAALARVRRDRWMDALDRRFFRDRYDAQRLLHRVSDEIARAENFERVGPRVVAEIEAALHPRFVALFVRVEQAAAYRVFAVAPPEADVRELPSDAKIVSLLKLLGKPIEVPVTGTGGLASQLPRSEIAFLQDSQIELLVPVPGGLPASDVLLALGTKRSEEPYSHEDQDLLALIADGLARLLERAPVAASAGTLRQCPECGQCFDSDAVICPTDGEILQTVGGARLVLSRYRLDRRLGQGGMGTVYGAFDHVLQRTVAIKLIRDDRVGYRDAVARFQREARLAASFVHPNVVTIHDSGVTATGQAYLVMELLDGRTLRDTMTRGPIEPGRVVSILKGITAAVDEAHRRQLIHRDLKPENVVLVQAGGAEIPKVLDFGIAKLLAGEAQTGTIDTTAGRVIGTLLYMPPEQLRGAAATPAWDLWALAVMAYEMIVGDHPFAGRQHARARPWVPGFEPPTDPLAAVPDVCRPFFARALASDPAARPATAAVLMDELARALTP